MVGSRLMVLKVPVCNIPVPYLIETPRRDARLPALRRENALWRTVYSLDSWRSPTADRTADIWKTQGYLID